MSESNRTVPGKETEPRLRSDFSESDAKKQVSDAKKQIEETTRAQLAQGRSQAAEAIEGVAHALRSAAGELQTRQQSSTAHYTERAAEGLDRLAGSLRGKSVEGIIRESEGFARRQPAVFFGAAVTAGFALSRFLKSSPPETRGQDRERGPEPSPSRETTFAEPGTRSTSTPGNPPSATGVHSRGEESAREGGRPWNE